MKFSQELLEKTKDYFWQKHGIGLCDLKAEEYLTSLCQLGFLLDGSKVSVLRRTRIAKQSDSAGATSGREAAGAR